MPKHALYSFPKNPRERLDSWEAQLREKKNTKEEEKRGEKKKVMKELWRRGWVRRRRPLVSTVKIGTLNIVDTPFKLILYAIKFCKSFLDLG